MIDADALLNDCKGLVRRLVEDLRVLGEVDRATADILEREYRGARGAERTALTRTEWAETFFAQIAVAWVLGCVFVRFCEDNGLVEESLLGGVGPRRDIAIDQRTAYVQAHPAHDDRHWLREVFARYRGLPGADQIFGAHNPVWLLSPSANGARELVQAFQAIDPDTGAIRQDFTDSQWGTRFFGDLYQDLSEQAKKFYALLQTPVFVEEFILDRTLEPALATFGLRETTLIDPACGSGHFLLGAFRRLFDRWQDVDPGASPRDLAGRALEAIAGIDLNPFAAAIARFRLLVAALRAGGDKRLVDAPDYRIHIAVGDSLLHGDPPGRLAGIVNDDDAAATAHGYSSEDVQEARALLTRSWHAVVGNPPYITPKDSALNDLYRRRFSACRGKYSMAVPFIELFFQLARNAGTEPERAGYVGMITANSFMKREFGKKLVDVWVPLHDLTHVLDTSGAYIPGHGTPTIILFGRNRLPVGKTVRVVMGIRGEPTAPARAEKGLVWSSIADLVDQPGSQSDFVSVSDLFRQRLAKHPWSIGGGGAAELKELMESRSRFKLGAISTAIGVTGISGDDDVALYPVSLPNRVGLPARFTRPLVHGEIVRDWRITPDLVAYFPYDQKSLLPLESGSRIWQWLWPFRTLLWSRITFSKQTYRQEGRPWWEWHQVALGRLTAPLSITFPELATHNHFAVDRGGRIFKQTALVIKLPSEVDERRHLELTGVLNSSSACFWMHQVLHNKGRPGAEAAAADEPYEFRFVHNGTKLQEFPLPAAIDPSTATRLDTLACELARVTPAAVAATGTPTVSLLADSHSTYCSLRARMIAAQECLDWEVYPLYGLADEELTTGDDPEPPLQLGERAFEIVLARKVAAGEEETSWFARHGSTPITELPGRWPDSYRKLVERRIELIETDLNIGLIERPEHKRRWAAKPWEEQVQEALRLWLLDRLESPRYWPQPPALTTCARLAAEARIDEEFVGVARLFAGRQDLDLGPLIADLVSSAAVPYLAAFRYTDTGLRKYQVWLATWDLQRREDAGEEVGSIPVPPKYVNKDFRPGSWEHRGKLDVPKERFISYPGAERGTDTSLVVGWAGWDHLGRARALAGWYLQARRDGRDTETHLKPLLAGLAELVPWLKQWFDEPNADQALNRPGTQIEALLETELRSLGLTRVDLGAWRPPSNWRGRRGRARA
jgi:hypothetical protein